MDQRALAQHRSVLIDEAIRMVTDVVAARTDTDPDTDVYPHLVTSVAISAIVTAFQFAPAGGPPSRTGSACCTTVSSCSARASTRAGEAQP